MDQNILKKLRFGFEIEGLFRKGMSERLNFRGNFVSDGSVGGLSSPFPENQEIPVSTPRSCRECTFTSRGEIVDYCREHRARHHREGTSATEYASNVFEDLDSCLHDLRLFNRNNHTYNHTCGLHFHVGMKADKWRQLFSVGSNLQYIKQLMHEALHYCPCQKTRLTAEWSTRYFANYTGRRDLANSARVEGPEMGNNQKYRFVRFHPNHKTLEFRFLSPCEHKISNVRKMLSSLIAYLARSESHKSYAIAETAKREDVEITFDDKLQNRGSNIDIVKRLKEPNPFEQSKPYQKALRASKLIAEVGEGLAAQMLREEEIIYGSNTSLGASTDMRSIIREALSPGIWDRPVPQTLRYPTEVINIPSTEAEF